METNLKQVTKQSATSLLREGTLVAVGNQRLFKIEDLQVSNSVLAKDKLTRVIGNQSGIINLVDVDFDYGAQLSLSEEQTQQVFTEEGMSYKKASELSEGDVVPVKTGLYKYQVDPLAYEFGRMSSMASTTNALIMLSEFILRHEVNQSVSWIEGFLNGSKTLDLICDDNQLKYCWTLANRIATLYSSIGQLLTIKNEKIVISSDNSVLSVRPRESALYLDVFPLDIGLNIQGTPVIVNVESNVNWFVDGKTVNKVSIVWNDCQDLVIPKEYGAWLYKSDKQLKSRCWSLPALSFLQGSNDLTVCQFMEAFANFDASEEIRKGLRFVNVKGVSSSYQDVGFNLFLKDTQQYIANGVIVEGQSKFNCK